MPCKKLLTKTRPLLGAWENMFTCACMHSLHKQIVDTTTFRIWKQKTCIASSCNCSIFSLLHVLALQDPTSLESLTEALTAEMEKLDVAVKPCKGVKPKKTTK